MSPYKTALKRKFQRLKRKQKKSRFTQLLLKSFIINRFLLAK
jgi:hypothetical protein